VCQPYARALAAAVAAHPAVVATDPSVAAAAVSAAEAATGRIGTGSLASSSFLLAFCLFLNFLPSFLAFG
jgi:hypothetical protein